MDDARDHLDTPPRQYLYDTYHRHLPAEQLPEDSPLEQSLFGTYNATTGHVAADAYNPRPRRGGGRLSARNPPVATHSFDQASMSFVPESARNRHAAESYPIFIPEPVLGLPVLAENQEYHRAGQVPGSRRLAENQEYLMSGQLPGAPVQVVCLTNTIDRTPIVLEDATYESLFGRECSICRLEFPRDYDEIDQEFEHDPPRLQPVRMTTFCCGETLFCTQRCVRRWFDGYTMCSTCSIMIDDMNDSLRVSMERARVRAHTLVRHEMLEYDESRPRCACGAFHDEYGHEDDDDDDDDEDDDDEGEYDPEDYEGEYESRDPEGEYESGDPEGEDEDEENAALQRALEASLDEALQASTEAAIAASLENSTAQPTPEQASPGVTDTNTEEMDASSQEPIPELVPANEVATDVEESSGTETTTGSEQQLDLLIPSLDINETSEPSSDTNVSTTISTELSEIQPWA